MESTNGFIEADRALLSAKMERLFEWRKWIEVIPFIEWPTGWKVRAVPPFNCAIIRYHVLKPGSDKWVSIYLDCYDELSLFGEPYWEVYPHQGDVFRCPMQDVEGLLRGISEAGDAPSSKQDLEHR